MKTPIVHQVRRLAGRLLLLAGALVAGRAAAAEDTCYVESTSGTYIDTDYCPCPETRIEVDFQFTQVIATTYVFGVNDGDSLSSAFYSSSGKQYAFAHGDGAISGVPTWLSVDTERHTAILDSYNGGAQNGVLQLKTGETVFWEGSLKTTRTKRSAFPLHFFAQNNRKSEVGGVKMRFYGAKIYEKGELVRDYIPCVRNGLVGIKDRVTGAFQYPTDLSALTAGEGVMSETTDDGYLESAGDGYIDTGYTPTQNTRVEADFELVDTTNVKSRYICGSSGLIYALYLNSASRYAFSAFDGATTQPSGAKGVYSDTGKAADSGVRHMFFADYYRKRAAFTTPGEARLSYDLASKMSATQATGSLLVFASSVDPNATLKARLYGLRISESGKLVHNYVPCVQDGANGLFDTMTEQFITFAAGKKGSVGGNVLVREDKAYVESTAGTYIDTDYYPCPETRIEVDFQFTEVIASTFVFAVNDGDSLSSAFYSSSGKQYAFAHGDGAISGVPTWLSVDTERHTAILDSYNGGEQDGVLQLKTGETVFWEGSLTTTRTKRSTAPLHFFAQNNRKSEVGGVKMRFYGAKIYEKGELVRDYIPCVRNGLVGIKDLVTGAFQYPTDLSALTAGDGVTSETTDDGYLESTGTDSIDTGYTPTQNTRVEADFELVDTTNVKSRYICGSSGLIYALYLNSASRYAFSAFDGATTQPSGAKGVYSDTGKAADSGVRHAFFVDYYRKRAAFTTAGEARLSYDLTSKMSATQATGSLLVFASSVDPNATLKMKLYGLRIFESGKVVHDYVPCVQDDLNGLYDKVSGQFLGYGCGSVGGDVLKRGTDACLISDGTQGIVSDYFANPNSKIVVDFSFNSLATKGQRMFGADSGNNPLLCSCYLNSGGYLGYCFSDAGNWTVLPDLPSADTRYVMTLDGPNGKATVTGGRYDYTADITAARTHTGSQPLGIFMDYANGFCNAGADIRLYSLKCYENGTLVRQYLPYKSGDTLGLYDTVTGKVFLNTRAGANPFEIKGMGTDGSGSALLATPKDTRAKWSKPAVLKAFAPGAVAYRWFEGDTEIEGETGAELSVARQPGRELVTYSVKPVFEVNGEQVEGEASSATIDHTEIGMMILVK